MGALLGKAACRLVYGKSPTMVLPTLGPSTSACSGSPPPTTTSEKESGVITQVEKVPLSSTTFPRRSKQYMTAKREAIITAACAFGNSFTLPLVPLHLLFTPFTPCFFYTFLNFIVLFHHQYPLLFTPFTPCFFYTFLNFIVLFHHQYPVAYFDGGHSSDIF